MNTFSNYFPKQSPIDLDVPFLLIISSLPKTVLTLRGTFLSCRLLLFKNVLISLTTCDLIILKTDRKCADLPSIFTNSHDGLHGNPLWDLPRHSSSQRNWIWIVPTLKTFVSHAIKNHRCLTWTELPLSEAAADSRWGCPARRAHWVPRSSMTSISAEQRLSLDLRDLKKMLTSKVKPCLDVTGAVSCHFDTFTFKMSQIRSS